jgi:hypothetical protein
MKTIVLLLTLALSLVGATSSFAQSSTTTPTYSPAFGYPSSTDPGIRTPATPNQTYSPAFGGYSQPNTSSRRPE